MHGTAYDKLNQLFHNRQAVVFCGAGISLEPPAGLPDWHGLRDYTLEAIAHLHPKLSDHLSVLTELEMIASPGKKGLTPEYVASVISHYNDSYFKCFQALDQGEPNANHRYLAKMAKLQHLKYIITTNFDVFLEKALQQEALEFTAYATDDDFAKFSQQPTAPGIHVFKIHGCLNSPDTITATVEQEVQGLSPAKSKVLKYLIENYYLVFWGYSGADLKIDLDYLKMVSMEKQAQGFIWNFLQRDNFREPINPNVAKLQQMYQEKGEIVHGKLPEIFDEILDDSEHIVRESYSYQQQQTLQQQKNQALQQAFRDWAQHNLNQWQAFAIFARLLKHSGQITSAEQCYRDILECPQCPYYTISEAYNELGYIYKILSDYETSLENFHKAKHIAEQHQDRKNLSLYLNSIAGIYRIQGKTNQALQQYQEAEKIAREIGDQGVLAIYLNKIGGIHLKNRSYDLAYKFFLQAEKITRETGNQIGLAINLDNIGRVYRARRDFSKALEFFKKAEEITRLMGDKQGLAVRLHSIAGIYSKKRETRNKAIQYYEQALKIAEDMGDKRGIILQNKNIGDVYHSMKKFARAIEYYQNSVAAAETISDTRNLADLYHKLGKIQQNQSQIPQAVEYFQKSLALYQQLKRRKEIAKLQNCLRQCNP